MYQSNGTLMATTADGTTETPQDGYILAKTISVNLVAMTLKRSTLRLTVAVMLT